MYKTKNTLADNTRKTSISLLQTALSSAIDLGLQCKQAHWNVKGPSFIALHELFDQLNTEVTGCLLYTSPSPRDRQKSRMPSSA